MLHISGEWGAGCHFSTMLHVLCRDTAMRYSSLGMDTVRLPKNDYDPNVRSGLFVFLAVHRKWKKLHENKNQTVPGTNVIVIGKKRGCVKINEEHL